MMKNFQPLLQELEALHEHRLSSWHRAFRASMVDRIKRGKPITRKMRDEIGTMLSDYHSSAGTPPQSAPPALDEL